MPSPAKVEMVKKLQEVINEYSDFFVTGYNGLSVADISDLRDKLREHGAVYQIVKNNIFKIALNNEKIEGLDEILVGPNAIVFTGDSVSSAKILKEFTKNKEMAEKVKIKMGYAEGKVIDDQYVKALADLPSKEELLAKLLGTMLNPATRLVRVLKNPLQKLTFALNAIAEQKQ